MSMKVLVTGGAGFIGSHTAVELLQRGYDIVVVDNLSNSSKIVIDRIKELTKKDFAFYQCDVEDYDSMKRVFSENAIATIIHFAGLKSNAESIEKPGLYLNVNIYSTFTLLRLMDEFSVNKMVFSSSATVYGTPEKVPDLETDEVGKVISPYGLTKYLNELLLKDFAVQRAHMKIIALRYFNPIGAHPSGRIGEDSTQQIPNNLVPYITKVMLGQLPHLNVYGNCYKTCDGTGLRDYIHVVDLARGHIAALDYLSKMTENYDVFNLGTGQGVTVLQLVSAFEKVSGLKIPYKIVGVRPGDVPLSYASVEKAKNILHWETKLNYLDCARDAWNWQKKNPKGYQE